METLEVLQFGYPFCMTFDDFIKHYKVIYPPISTEFVLHIYIYIYNEIRNQKRSK